MEIDVGLRIPEMGDGIIMRIMPTGSTIRTPYLLTVEQALELARVLQLMADLHVKLRKEKP